MIATLPTSEVSAISRMGYTAKEKQALIHQYAVIGRVGDRVQEMVVARLYAPHARHSSRVVCVLWVIGKGISSSGFTQGHNAHRGSYALSDAIYNAGISLDEGIHGRGDLAMREALLAIARAAYPDAEIFGVFEANN